jgi:hypothetical protein
LVTNKSELIVSYTDNRPVQFDLCTLPSADTFIDKEGSGWNKTNIAEYFSVTSTDQGNGGTQRHNQRHQNMTTSLQYEVHHIMLWTIQEIRVTSVKNKKQFHVRCHLKTYKLLNSSLCERHSTVFREDTFTFTPIDELVMPMNFVFISNLKVGTWTHLDPSWLRRLHIFLIHADNHAIKQIRFVRRINRTMLYAESQEYVDEHDRNLYEVFPTKGDKYYVNYMQIHDIV